MSARGRRRLATLRREFHLRDNIAVLSGCVAHLRGDLGLGVGSALKLSADDKLSSDVGTDHFCWLDSGGGARSVIM